MCTTRRTVDLTFVPPERRHIVQSRIDAIERFKLARSSAAAQLEASTLGISRSLFYLLVRQWDDGAKPEHLSGSGRAVKRPAGINPAQLEVIHLADEAAPTGPISRSAAIAIDIGKRRNVPMPGIGAIRKHLKRLRTGRYALDVKNADLIVIDHCAIDIAAGPTGCPDTMPIITLVMDARRKSVLGVAASHGLPTALAAAKAMMDALRNVTPSNEGEDCRGDRLIIRLQCDDALQWADLVDILTNAGPCVETSALTPHTPGAAMTAMLGDRPAGVLLRRWHTFRGQARRPAAMRRTAVPIPLDEFADMMRGRLVTAGSPNVLNNITRHERATLTRRLAELIKEQK